MNTLINFNRFIKNIAKNSGFSLCGVVPASAVDITHQDFLKNWISSGRNADMRWFERNEYIRFNPSLILDSETRDKKIIDNKISDSAIKDSAKTIVVFAYPYNPIKLNESYNIASYAQSTDYHFVLKNILNGIITEIKSTYGEDIEARAFTDSAPIMERYWAKKAGFGWIGKSGIIINREEGSFILLCEIVLNKESDIYDKELTFNGCGDCRICIDSCPTSAICEDKSIDARKCLSYLTIEHRGDFTPEQIDIIKSSKSDNKWLYGCDECLMCCPWNRKKVENMKESSILLPKGDRCKTPLIQYPQEDMSNINIENMSNSEFKMRFNSSPLMRTGLKYIKRNAKLN